MCSQLLISVLLDSDALAQSLTSSLKSDRYKVNRFGTEQDLFDFIELEQQIDCLILQNGPHLSQIVNQLHSQTILLPTVIVQPQLAATSDSQFTQMGTLTTKVTSDPAMASDSAIKSVFPYHAATVLITADQISEIAQHINQAITQFLKLSPTHHSPDRQPAADLITELTTQNSLMLQQRRLTEKLKERLGYLGVYYKRDPKNFLRHLSPDEKLEFVEKLKLDYREIALIYFSGEEYLNQKIDDFVNTAFFADVSVAQIVEIHMELIDEFSKQLKLEGRSDEILLDYRLTLIDTIAHLCEMYRRSIPRES